MSVTTTRLEQSVATACEQGAMCVHDRSGHQLGTLQLRLALATPAGWNDAFVAEVSDQGWISVVDLDGTASTVWHHQDLTGRLTVGTPVAVHARYDVLVAGELRINIAR